MPGYDEIARNIGFSAEDISNLHSLQAVVKPLLPVVVERFYDDIRRNPEALALFTGGESQLRDQQRILSSWLADLFDGPYDLKYFDRTEQAGRTHVRHNLPQHYMVVGFEVIWQEFSRGLQDASIADAPAKLASLHKLLNLQLALMLEAYKDRYAEKVRDEEHSIVEERLTRAEHLAEIGQLAASLAHEIKNPLAGISGAIQVIREGMWDDDVRQPIINEILVQIKRLDDTVKDLLLYARPTPPERGHFSLVQSANRVLSVLREEPALQRIRVESTGANEHLAVQADPRQIEQLIINLVLNAAHASANGDAVELTVTGSMEFVTLAVKDSGIGMSSETQKRAFEPFFTTKARGTGLGLSICRRIAEVHGGRINLKSALGKGTTVFVELPRSRLTDSDGTTNDCSSSDN